ncbi:MAG: DUF2806 domain-containing protein [Bradyrhizobium sp.]
MNDLPNEQSNKSPLVEINAVKLNVTGLENFERVANNVFEALTRGIGKIYEPIGRVRDAKAERAVLNERAQTFIDLAAKANELRELSEIAPDERGSSLAARSIGYMLEDFSRRQGNREKTAQAFIEDSNQVPPSEDASTPIDPDWLTKYWTLAENVSKEELRIFIAQLLTKETRKPGTVSPLTLNTLSMMTRQIAECFERFCCLSIAYDADAYVIHPNVFPFQNIGPLEEFGISYDDLYELESFGLIRSAQTIMLNYVSNMPAKHIDYAGTRAELNLSGLQLHLIHLTRAGRELRNSLHLSPLPNYTAALAQKLGDAFVLRPS